MKVRVIAATAVGIAASAAVGVGIYGLLHLGDCEPAGNCAMSSGLLLVLFNVGLPVSILAIVAGGGQRVMTTLLLAVGGGAVAAGGSFGWVFGGAFLLVGCVVLGAIVYFRRFASPSTAMATVMGTLAGAQDPLDGPGQPAVGTVLAVSDMGTTVNDDPLARLRLRVEPADGSEPFEAVARKLVSRLATPRPGDRFAVEYDPADRTRLAVREALPAEPRAASLVDQLGRLDELRRSGALTQSEFETAKQRVLGPAVVPEPDEI